MLSRLAQLLGLRPTVRCTPRAGYYRPALEGLEDRTVLAAPGSMNAPAFGAALVAQATQEVNSLIPIRVTNIEIRDGSLFAVGTIGGRAFETELDLQLSENQPENQAEDACPILSLMIEEIHLNLLGLRVDTSDICLDITAEEGPGNLLGNLLCDIAHLLDGGLSLDDLLGTGANALTGAQAVDLTNGLEDILNDVFGRLTDVSPGSLTDVSVNTIGSGGRGRTTDILNLSLGPVNLDVLGLDVNLDDCEGGPVTIDITAQRGPGNLLGNLISGLAGVLDGRGGGNRLDRLIDRIVDEIRDLLDLDQVGQVIPLQITNVVIRDGQLIGLGQIGGTTFEVPLELALADVQPADADCPILDLRINSINLNLLGLEVETSDICLNIAADEGPGNLLGNLLCDVAHLLDGGLSLSDLLGTGPNALSAEQAVALTNGLDDLLNDVFSRITDASAVTGAGTDILNLSLGPVNLDVLGLLVNLDDCDGGPVTVDIRAVPGPGNLLGNLLSQLAGLLDAGAGSNVINRLIGRITDQIGGLI